MAFVNPPQTAPFYNVLQNLKSEIFKGLRVCMPATVTAFYPEFGTVDILPALMQTSPGGSPYTYPQLLGCPVINLQGSGLSLSFPIKIGDECLVFFSDRCIDSWKQVGTPMPLPSFRMHDLSDGFVLVGLNSQANPLLTLLSASEGGLSTLTAKIAIDTLTDKISIANGVAGVNNLLTILNLLLTTLETLNTALAADPGLSGASHTALGVANTALILVSTELGLLLQ